MVKNTPMGISKRFEYPRGNFPRLCLIGNSNVGKSSLTKFFLTHPNYYKAKIGKIPGSTRKLMLVDDPNLKHQIIDLPGFGHMKRNTRIEEGFIKDQILKYIELDASNIFLMLMVISADRLDEELEKWYFQNPETIPLSIEFIQYILEHEIPCICVLNKIDKLNQYEERNLLTKLREVLLDFSIQEQGLEADSGLLKILPISMKDKVNPGREELKKFIRSKANRLNMADFDSRKELYKKPPINKTKQ